MPYRKAFTLELPAGPIGVVGMHAGNARRSNRAGKTSFLRAITWALYGLHHKRYDDEVINRQADECSVELTMGCLRVRRSRKRGDSTKLQVTEFHDDARVDYTGAAAQDTIERYLSLTSADYLATSCFQQGEVESVIQKTPSQRLQVVSQWLQQEIWLHAKKVQAHRVTTAETQLAVSRAALATAKGQALAPALRKALEAEGSREKAAVDTARQSLGSLTASLAGLAESRLRASKEAELRELRVDAALLRKSLTQRKASQERLAACEAQATGLELITQQRAAELNTFRQTQGRGFDGRCPVTCTTCPVSAEVSKAVAQQGSRLAVLTTSLETAGMESSRARHALAEARALNNSYERQAAEYSAAVERGKQLQSELGSSSSANASDVKGSDIEKQIDEQHLWLAHHTSRVAEIKAMLEASDVAESKSVVLEKEALAAEKRVQVSKLALQAIAAVPARIAAQQLMVLEQDTNVLLADTGVSLRFSWQRELADKSSTCDCGYIFPSKRGDVCTQCGIPRGKKTANELEFLCNDGSGLEEDIAFNSGGTRAVVGAALRLAAAAMLRRMRSSPVSWVIADEPFAALDTDNREGLARTFAGMLSSVGLDQALVVSHDIALLDALPHRIVADKSGGNSTLRVE